MTANRALGTRDTLPDEGRHHVLPVSAFAVAALVGALAGPGVSPPPVDASPAYLTASPANASPGHSTASPAHSTAGPVLLATPILSPARLPRTLQALHAQQALSAALGTALSAQRLGAAGAADSCAEVAQDGRVIFSYHPSLPVMPASNMKLVTATALIDRLGPSYTFHTKLEAAPPVDGVVHGNLYLVGGGDPLLRLPSYAADVMYGGGVFTNVTKLASELKAAGAREVTGSVVGDDSRYDSQRSVAGWPARYFSEGDVGQLSAVGIDDGMAVAGPPVPDSAPPAEQSAGVVTNLLTEDGVSVQGAPTAGRAPSSGLATLVDLSSPPLSSVLGEVLRESDNTAMELMTKELGLKVSGVGSTAAGTAAVRADLATDGIPTAGLVNHDGSGLSPADRVTCGILLDVLERAGADGLLVRDLPVAARSGTLSDEMKGTAAAGRVRAKTGTLNHVKALSGWALPVPGQGGGNPALAQPVVFTTVLNGLPLSLANIDETTADLTDAVAVDVAQYPKAPALAQFEP